VTDPSAPDLSQNTSSRSRDASLAAPIATRAGWTDVDVRAVDTVRVLAADAVQKAGNGHPGTAMSLAPLAYLLFQKVMRFDPADPEWLGRDRFVLSCGHSSLTQYIQLYLSGYGLELDDLKSLRTWGSRTPGHPELRHTRGVDITTGPLGSGLASAVGMAIAQRRQRGLFDPDAAPGQSPFDHHIYVVASDGDIMEGVSHEASALAGHQELGNLTVIYDQNHISIEDDTNISFSEDVGKRYEAYGWHVVTVDWRGGWTPASNSGVDVGHDYVEDVDALLDAIESGKAVDDKPTLVILKTVIAWPAPTKQNTGASHGSALGEPEIAATKVLLGFDPAQTFEVDADVLAHARAVKERGKAAHARWDRGFAVWRDSHATEASLLDRVVSRKLPADFATVFPTFPADPKGIATRSASGKVLTALADVLPELWGGSADLAGSNNTTMDGAPSFIPTSRQTEEYQGGPFGRTLHFGIREFGMGCILNGITLEGLTRAYGGTFLVFSDYMRPAVRLAALQKLPVTFVWTHDSIGLGEDGPTHQPIEHLAALRAIPGLDVVRPGDANETAVAWRTILEHDDRPAGLMLSRQALPTLDRETFASAEGTARGAYVLIEGSLIAGGGSSGPAVILIATGSEVSIAVAAREILESQGISTRIVSMPCREWFEAADQAYRDEVLLPGVRARVSIEAGVPLGWRDFVGDAGRIVSLDHFGASADGPTLFREFGFTPAAVVAAAQESIRSAAGQRAGGE
jgi:transketolase